MVWKCSCTHRTCFHLSLWHPGRAPGRHHMTISESLTCFSDPKVFSLKFSQKMKGCETAGVHSNSLPSCIADWGRSFLELHLCVTLLTCLNGKYSLFLLSDFFYYLPPPLFLPHSSFLPLWSGSSSRCFSSVLETISAGLVFSCSSSVRKLFNLGFNSLEQGGAICNPWVLITVS